MGAVFPKIRGFLPPKWMVKIMEKPIKMDDLAVFLLFLETPKSRKDEIPGWFFGVWELPRSCSLLNSHWCGSWPSPFLVATFRPSNFWAFFGRKKHPKTHFRTLFGDNRRVVFPTINFQGRAVKLQGSKGLEQWSFEFYRRERDREYHRKKRDLLFQGSLNWTHKMGGIKQYTSMAILKDFSL